MVTRVNCPEECENYIFYKLGFGGQSILVNLYKNFVIDFAGHSKNFQGNELELLPSFRGLL